MNLPQKMIPQKMNSLKAPRRVLAAILLTALTLLLPAVSARAFDSFGMTNVIPASTGFASYPTNTPATNGLGMFTGGAVSVKQVTDAGFSFTCTPVTNTKGITNTVVLITSQADQPAITTDTNGWTTVQPWDQYPSNSANGLLFSFTIPALQTNCFTFNTNLGEAFVRAANWIGIYAFTNGSAYVQSNTVCGLNKKPTVFRWP